MKLKSLKVHLRKEKFWVVYYPLLNLHTRRTTRDDENYKCSETKAYRRHLHAKLIGGHTDNMKLCSRGVTAKTQKNKAGELEWSSLSNGDTKKNLSRFFQTNYSLAFTKLFVNVVRLSLIFSKHLIMSIVLYCIKH